MSRATTKSVQMACLTIAYNKFILPADKAMKVAELMQHAMSCSWDYKDRGNIYSIEESPKIEFTFVRNDEISMPNGEAFPETKPTRRTTPAQLNMEQRRLLK